MIFYNVWEARMIDVRDMFWIIATLGAVLFGAQFILWIVFTRSRSLVNKSVLVSEKDSLLEITQMRIAGGTEGAEESRKNVQEKGLTLIAIFTGWKFYFFVLLSAVNMFRIRYFLGIAGYTLEYLHDTGTYLQLLGYCFALSIVFGPISEKILATLDDDYKSLHLVNIAVTSYFITWLIPSLQVQVITFILFIIARLLCFAVLSEYCSKEFTNKRFGLVLGSGFLAASVPGAFTFGIVDVVLKKFHGNFWLFHLMCILISVPLSLLIYVAQRKSTVKVHITYERQSESYMSI